MRTIVGEANRRRITLAQLSRLTGRDPDALKRSFRTERPQLATVEALTTALNRDRSRRGHCCVLFQTATNGN